MKKSFGILWGIVFVSIVAWNAHAMPWKPTDTFNPPGETIAIGDCRWNQIGWGFIKPHEFESNQQVKFLLSHLEFGLVIPKCDKLNTLGTSSLNITRLSNDFNLSDSSLNTSESENNSNSVPEPATMLIFGGGLIGMAIVGRKKIINLM
jgi:hypothetical protein